MFALTTDQNGRPGAEAYLQHGLALRAVDPRVGRSLGRDGEALPPPQHGGGRVGHHVAADVHRVPLPRVVNGVVGQELGDVCSKKAYFFAFEAKPRKADAGVQLNKPSNPKVELIRRIKDVHKYLKRTRKRVEIDPK